MLYANGAVGGIVNIVDNSIAKQDIESFKFNVGAGYEDGNGGDTGSASFVGNIGGINVTSSVQYSDLGNYAIPEGAVIDDEEEHEEEEEHDHDANTLKNSDFTKTGYKLGLSKVEDWGYVGLSYADSSSTYGIPFHGDNHEDEHQMMSMEILKMSMEMKMSIQMKMSMEMNTEMAMLRKKVKEFSRIQTLKLLTSKVHTTLMAV